MGNAFLRRLDAVMDGVADQVHEGIGELFPGNPVEFDLLTRDCQPHLPTEARGCVRHGAAQARCEECQRTEPRLQQLGLQVAGKPQLSVEVGLQTAVDLLQTIADGGGVSGRFTEGLDDQCQLVNGVRVCVRGTLVGGARGEGGTGQRQTGGPGRGKVRQSRGSLAQPVCRLFEFRDGGGEPLQATAQAAAVGKQVIAQADQGIQLLSLDAQGRAAERRPLGRRGQVCGGAGHRARRHRRSGLGRCPAALQTGEHRVTPGRGRLFRRRDQQAEQIQSLGQPCHGRRVKGTGAVVQPVEEVLHPMGIGGHLIETDDRRGPFDGVDRPPNGGDLLPVGRDCGVTFVLAGRLQPLQRLLQGLQMLLRLFVEADEQLLPLRFAEQGTADRRGLRHGLLGSRCPRLVGLRGRQHPRLVGFLSEQLGRHLELFGEQTIYCVLEVAPRRPILRRWPGHHAGGQILPGAGEQLAVVRRFASLHPPDQFVEPRHGLSQNGNERPRHIRSGRNTLQTTFQAGRQLTDDGNAGLGRGLVEAVHQAAHLGPGCGVRRVQRQGAKGVHEQRQGGTHLAKVPDEDAVGL